MTDYLVLLRGINVGGKNKLPMGDLKEVLTGVGYLNVVSYIQSGNLFLSGPRQDNQALADRLTQVIKDHFDLGIPVFVIKTEEFLTLAKTCPAWWLDNQADNKLNVIFVMGPETSSSIIAKMGTLDESVEQVHGQGPLLYWKGSKAHYSRLVYAKLAKQAFYQLLTIRNAKTFNRLVSMGRDRLAVNDISEIDSPIQAYINQEEGAHRDRLQAVYNFIKQRLPEAEERIAYGMPTFKAKRNIIHFAAMKDHLGIYPGSQAIEHFQKDLSEFKTSKGTWKIPYDKEIPWDLLGALVDYNLKLSK